MAHRMIANFFIGGNFLLLADETGTLTVAVDRDAKHPASMQITRPLSMGHFTPTGQPKRSRESKGTSKALPRIQGDKQSAPANPRGQAKRSRESKGTSKDGKPEAFNMELFSGRSA